MTVIENSDGDMRKALNILQSISMSYKRITSDNVNKCLGTLNKKDMMEILKIILKNDIKTAHKYLSKTMVKKNITLYDIINKLHNILFEIIIDNVDYSSINIDKKEIIKLLQYLTIIENNTHVTISDDIQLLSLLGIFKLINLKK